MGQLAGQVLGSFAFRAHPAQVGALGRWRGGGSPEMEHDVHLLDLPGSDGQKGLNSL